MNKAVDLAQVIRFFDPRHPLEGQELDHWFIERPETPRHELEFFLRSIQSDDKMLFIGPRGSGKTTELNKLAVALADSFIIIPIPTMDLVGRADLNYVDLMLAIATQVTATAVDKKVLPKSVSATVRQGLEDPLRWWKIIFDEAGLRLPAEEQSVQLQLKFMVGEIQLGAKQSPATRTRLIDSLSPRLPELIRTVNWILDRLRTPDRRVLLIVEGLDKIDQAAAETLFRDHATTMTAFKAATIFTFPNALRHSDHFETIKNNFEWCDVFPNFALQDTQGAWNQTAIDAFSQAALKRLDQNLIDPEALDIVVRASGGQIKSLVTLVQRAAAKGAARQRPPASITVEDVLAAIKTLRRDLVGPLNREDFATLKARHANRKATIDDKERRLLYNGTLLEYSNGQPWCDVHPALWELLERPEDADPDAE